MIESSNPLTDEQVDLLVAIDEGREHSYVDGKLRGDLPYETNEGSMIPQSVWLATVARLRQDMDGVARTIGRAHDVLDAAGIYSKDGAHPQLVQRIEIALQKIEEEAR